MSFQGVKQHPHSTIMLLYVCWWGFAWDNIVFKWQAWVKAWKTIKHIKIAQQFAQIYGELGNSGLDAPTSIMTSKKITSFSMHYRQLQHYPYITAYCQLLCILRTCIMRVFLHILTTFVHNARFSTLNDACIKCIFARFQRFFASCDIWAQWYLSIPRYFSAV